MLAYTIYHFLYLMFGRTNGIYAQMDKRVWYHLSIWLSSVPMHQVGIYFRDSIVQKRQHGMNILARITLQ